MSQPKRVPETSLHPDHKNAKWGQRAEKLGALGAFHIYMSLTDDEWNKVVAVVEADRKAAA